MDRERQLLAVRRAVDAALDRFLPPASARPRILHRAMRYSVFSGGKRIRPIITAMACRACGGTLRAALPAAAAVECVHTYSLIHDDLPAMDDDDYRRGRRTCHKVFGEATAILAGDGLLTLAFGILAERYQPRIAQAAIVSLAGAIGTHGMVGGQAMDVASQGSRPTREALDRTNDLKTARLFEASARIGALVARSGDRKVRAMASYGAAIGRAFQVIDDCLDRDGYAALIGAERSRMLGLAYTDTAKAALRPFGAGGSALAALADRLAHRIR